MPSLKAMAREAQTKPQSTALKQPSSRRRTLFKSTEKVEESDIESETESESGSDLEEVTIVATVPVRKLNGQKLNPVAAKGVVQSVENGHDSRRHGNAIVPSKHNGASGENSNQSSGHSSDESEGESDSGSGSGSGSSSERGSDESSSESSGSDSDSEDASQPTKLKLTAGYTSSHTEENSEALPNEDRAILKYDPPDGFTINPESTHAKEKVTDIFGQSNLAGKQLWYITAPSSVPISAVKQVSLQDVQLGKPALSIRGRHYGFVQEQAEDINFKKVLIPDWNSGVYLTGHKAIDRTLHLQQIVELHKTDESSTPNPGRIPNTGKRSVRKQPEGLKMRFRPIGFGHGKVGAIGSSSPSTDTSSTADTDTDDSMEDAPPVSRQSLNIDQANMRLHEDTSRSSANQEQAFSSGEETDSPQPANSTMPGQIDSTSESDTSSENSNSDAEGSQKVTPVSEKLISPSPRPVKRKINTFLKDSRSSNSAPNSSKPKGTPLQNTSGKKTAPALGKPELEISGSESARKRRALSSLPSELTQLPQLFRSVPASSSTDGPTQSIAPVLPPRRQTSILPPQKWSKSPDAPRVAKANGKSPEGSLAEVISLQSTSKMNSHKNLKDGTQSIDLALSDKARKREIRRLKKNEASRSFKIQRGESINNSTNDILDKSVNTLSASRNVQEYPSQSRLHPKSTVDKTLPQNAKSVLTTNMGKSPKKITKANSTLAIHGQNGERAKSNQDSSTTVPAVRKESVILPPKLNRSISR